jgi:hypothetical protein
MLKQGQKTFYGEPFRKDTLSSSSINQVMRGHDYHGIKNKPFELFVTGFFESNTNKNILNSPNVLPISGRINTAIGSWSS